MRTQYHWLGETNIKYITESMMLEEGGGVEPWAGDMKSQGHPPLYETLLTL